ncbi:MAG: rhamnogalacturonan acetylesterase [Acholeplasmatales bacterium]|nr:rhamnogalacturonan acetylesterase [Acholeplasmatales bacterium]
MSNIYMMGDSTMKFNNYYSYPQFGWGQGLELFVKEGVLIFNHAENGRSTKSFIDEGRFDKILKDLKKGDYVICSFGHNDEKIQDPNRYTEPFGSYQDNLKYFMDEVHKKGAEIVFATSITRHKFENGKCVNSHGDYPKAMLEFAKKYNQICIDLNKITIDLYTKLGEEKSKKFHMIFGENVYSNYKEGKDDHSHLVLEGASTIAYLFVKEMSKIKSGLNDLFIDLSLDNQIDFEALKD